MWSKEPVRTEGGTTTNYILKKINNPENVFVYDYITRMDPERLTNRFFAYFLSKKTKGVWFTEEERDLQEVGITRENIENMTLLKRNC